MTANWLVFITGSVKIRRISKVQMVVDRRDR